jgi:hypothetical protein
MGHEPQLTAAGRPGFHSFFSGARRNIVGDENPNSIADRVIELCGDNFMQMMEDMIRELDLFNQQWNQQDRSAIGRVLGAHLFVEHYIDVYLKAMNPNLVNLDDARLRFTQKVVLITSDSPMINELIPGIKRLNTIRNRIAHTLQAGLNDGDKECFLSIPYFNALREAVAKPDTPSDDVLDIIDDFALQCASRLESDANPSELSKIMKLAAQDQPKGSGSEKGVGGSEKKL